MGSYGFPLGHCPLSWHQKPWATTTLTTGHIKHLTMFKNCSCFFSIIFSRWCTTLLGKTLGKAQLHQLLWTGRWLLPIPGSLACHHARQWNEWSQGERSCRVRGEPSDLVGAGLRLLVDQKQALLIETISRMMTRYDQVVLLLEILRRLPSISGLAPFARKLLLRGGSTVPERTYESGDLWDPMWVVSIHDQPAFWVQWSQLLMKPT